SMALDMCAEHGVLEAICTRCHPKLIPIFQAKGDWCLEHEFPESVCPICHPERGGRPTTAVASDNEPPADRTQIRFRTLDIARKAGLETVVASMGMDVEGISATAKIVADASRTALVNARVPGVVSIVHVELGAKVERGAALATVKSSAAGEEQSKLQAARSRAAVAKARLEREEDLYAKGVSAQKEVEEARQEFEQAQADVQAARAALGMIGSDETSVGSYVLRAPIPGVVTKRSATVGTLVETQDPLFEIIDTAALWAEIDLPEAQAWRVHPGQRVLLTVDGMQNRSFSGNIRYVAPVVDPRTRTVLARAELDGDIGGLRANAYARAKVLTDEAQARLVVPKTAVQEARGVDFVYVQLGEGSFEARRVRTEPAGEGVVAVLSGLRENERVVTTGSFLLKTETLKESIGAGCCDIEPPKR
ncbi:MAG TPA: efflux RND transporter periplasmic adaptor subunit, partial [Candidatus Eisenbacteria bacterium]|nr:efflux RND transporter periplasmic adaptor subunit [Candidatus Eisenbacteria bacterium]